MAEDPRRDLIVVGGSAGGLDALLTLVRGLPADLPAAVCVVLHRPPYVPSRVPQLLERGGPLRATAAVNGAALEPGRIYVAPPDQHLLVVRDGPAGTGMLRLTRGPKENRSRPAVDPLFRSAALAYGPRVIGVILSGALDDGTAGLWAVRDRGGLAVVQDPADAVVASMPASAIAEVGADHVVPTAALGPLLATLAGSPLPAFRRAAGAAEPTDELRREVAMAAVDDEAHERTERYGAPSRFACPECNGVLWDTTGGAGPLRMRCSTGHAFSAAALAELQVEQVERALWAALRALEDKGELARLRAAGAAQHGLAALAARYEAQRQASLEQASVIRALLRLDGRTGMQAEDPSGGVERAANAVPSERDRGAA